MNRRRQWDIFCKVIDNFGDIGVCWRLAASLASRGQQVRLWTDDASALEWMAPGGHCGVGVHAWPTSVDAVAAAVGHQPCEMLIEAFGCTVPPTFLLHTAAMQAAAMQPGEAAARLVWINLEYLSAEAYVERCHGLASPAQSAVPIAARKFFFYPGFTQATGGLLREPDIAARQAAFDRPAWLAEHGIALHDGEVLVSLFCYEPVALAPLLGRLAHYGHAGRPVRLLVTAGRASATVQSILTNKKERFRTPLFNSLLSISYLPLLTQHDFDHLLWACDLNFVRGEDSAVRAIWAGKPFVWQLYPQDDGAQAAKLDAFLDCMGAPASLRQAHHVWNANSSTIPITDDAQPQAELPSLDLAVWGSCAQAARSQLSHQDDLCSQLMGFAEKSRLKS